MDRNASLRINDRPVNPEILEQRMRDLAATAPQQTVYLRGDRNVPYGEVLRVMDRIRKAGVTRVALVTVPLESGPESRR